MMDSDGTKNPIMHNGDQPIVSENSTNGSGRNGVIPNDELNGSDRERGVQGKNCANSKDYDPLEGRQGVKGSDEETTLMYDEEEFRTFSAIFPTESAQRVSAAWTEAKGDSIIAAKLLLSQTFIPKALPDKGSPQTSSSSQTPSIRPFPMSPPRPSVALNGPLVREVPSDLDDDDDDDLVATTQLFDKITGSQPSRKPVTPPRSPPKTEPEIIDLSLSPASSLNDSQRVNVRPNATLHPPHKRKIRGEDSIELGSQSSSLRVSHSSAPSKRRKSSSAFKKHDEYWLLDGNVIIRVKRTDYKLHRSRLVKHSTFFECLIKQAPDEVVTTDAGDCPLYCIDQAHVKGRDFDRLLDAMDDAISYVYSTPEFETVASVVRASTSLTFTRFQEWGRHYLTNMWSSDLANVAGEAIPFAVESILLARSCNINSILKRALYELARARDFGRDDDEEEEAEEGLTGKDYRRLFSAREKLHTAWAEHSRRHFRTDSCPLAEAHKNARAENGSAEPPCSSLDDALSSQKHERLVHQSGIFEQFYYDPVCGLDALKSLNWAEEGYCADCVAIRQRAWEKGKEKVWENVDIWFAPFYGL